MANKNQKNMATINNTQNNKEENTMNTKTTTTKTATTKTTTKKEENTMGASVKLTKVGCGTITFVQPNKGDLVSYTVFGVTTKITKEETEKVIEDFKSNDWKITEIVERNESKVASVKLEEKKEMEKPTTYTEAIEAKYGTKEEREEKMRRKNELWREMSATILAEVRKSGKYLRKDAWKNEMYTRLEKNPEWMAITGGKRQ